MPTEHGIVDGQTYRVEVDRERKVTVFLGEGSANVRSLHWLRERKRQGKVEVLYEYEPPVTVIAKTYTVEVEEIEAVVRANLSLNIGDVRLTVRRSDGAYQVVVIPGTDELDGYQVWFPSEAEAQVRPSGINLCTGGHYT